MNLILRSAIAAAACTMAASAANALTRAEYSALAAANKVYVGGATATDNTLENVLIATTGGICDPQLAVVAGVPRVDIYRAANQRVVTCLASNDNTPGHGFATRAAGGTQIAVHKESAGGSSNGVTPLIAVAKGQAHALRWLDVGNLPNDCTVTTVPATANLTTYINHAGCALVQTPPDTAGSAGAAGTFDVNGGISDNEPKLAFPSPGADALRLNSSPGVGIVFGVPVTTKLYRALQQSQFGVGSACDGSDANTCVPSLTRSQISSLYSQNEVDWNNFKNAAGTGLVDLATDAPADELVRICRRVSASGTQASFEAYFLNQRCVSGVAGFALPDDASSEFDTTYSPNDFVNGSLVNAGPSSGDVRSCLTSAQTNDFWAIGVLSTEVTDANFDPNGASAGDAGFRMIAIDGAPPTLANVANGDYNFFTENTINRISNTFPGNLGALADGLVKREVVELIDERLGNTAALANLNATFDNRPWGNGGLLALGTAATTNTAPYSVAEMASQPVNSQIRGGNTCGPALTVKPTPADGITNNTL